MKDFKWKRLAILLLCLLMCLSSALAEDSEAALPGKRGDRRHGRR